jgi:hypothetical protein
MASTDTHATIQELLEAVFCVRSVPRLHNEGQLRLLQSFQTAVRRAGGRYEMAASLGVNTATKYASSPVTLLHHS